MTSLNKVDKCLALMTVLVASAFILLPAKSSAAQGGQPDVRWRPWLGCWSPAAPQAIGSPEAGAREVCVVPAEGSSAVDIVTIADHLIVSREHIEASGERRRTERDGCTGWESAEWSSDARRVYLRAKDDCAGGVKRSSSGLIAMSLKGEWLNVVGVSMRENMGVRVLRHRPLSVTAPLPTEIASALEGNTPSIAAARAAVASPVGTTEIVEASRRLDGAIVEAWLGELGQTFTVDAKRLVELADARVPDRVIDVVVALSYPKAFAIRPSPNAIGSLADQGGSGMGFGGVAGGVSMLDCGSTFSLYGWDNCSPYGYGAYGYPDYGYGAYGYPDYGYAPYGYRPSYGGWYLAAPPIIILGAGSTDDATHGQVVKGRGYSQGRSGDSDASGGGTAVATPGTSGPSSGGNSTAGSPGPSSGGGGGGSSSGGERTARPR